MAVEKSQDSAYTLNRAVCVVYGFFPGDAVPSDGRRLIFCNTVMFSLAKMPRRAQECARGLGMNFVNSHCSPLLLF